MLEDNFSQQLQQFREAKGFKQSDLSEMTGFQVSAISHFETGRRLPSLENLIRLADALQVSTDELLGRNQSSNNHGQ